MEDKETRNYLQVLKNLKEGYSDEIPREILHSSMSVKGQIITPKYKCRKGWFFCFFGYVELGIDSGIVTGRSKELYEEAYRYFERTALQKRNTEEGDITRANEVLNSVIGDLEKMLNQKPDY